jgi:hypothetical protein
VSCYTFEIDDLVIAPQTLLEFRQEYTELRPLDFRRSADNSGFLRTTALPKLATTVESTGWIPSGFTSLDRGTTHTLKCAMIRSRDSSTETVTLPAGRRSDIDPIGFAIVDRLAVVTTITNLADILAGTTDDAILATVGGADSYRVHYWPEITCVILSNTSSGEQDGDFEWQLEAEEV